MIFGNNEVTYRKAGYRDLDRIKKLADKHKEELGFIVSAALVRSIGSSEIIVATRSDDELLGFVHYHHRKDGQTTLYNIVVNQPWRRQGLASRLIGELCLEARELGQRFVLLKCPIELPANDFYHSYGFDLSHGENGKHRALNIWRLDL